MADGFPDGAVLAGDALEWLLAEAREDGAALAWTGRPDDDELDPTLYSGTAGIVLALLEGYRHFGDERFAVAAVRGDLAAARGLDLLRARFDGHRWADQFELLGGNAGIALAAAAAGDLDLAILAVTPYLATAEPTPGGVHWEVRAGLPARFHHISHGTLGIVYALAVTGDAANRQDLVELALAGAADVVSRDEAGPDGFLVPHSDPQHRPERIERYSYGWCHGPAGDAQVFRLLAGPPSTPWAHAGATSSTGPLPAC
jgi:hypothetical protein